LAPWDSRHALRPFYESLRDRLINFFEIKNLTHKPKLVALSSVSEGAGVSTIAAGLAAALSETGEGNVLLVDMNLQNGAAHHFRKGDLACGIDEALITDRRSEALVQENLYVVSERDSMERLPGILPKRFKTLVPRLKASDYDYIIFDMPPVTQISITPRLARFMDMVFLVAESEKSDRDAIKRAGALLAESKTNVGVLLNKRREYMPKGLRETI
jgi:Mrp family chromosome partitioning ATPase